jgi:transcription termination factor Rho
VSLFPRSEILGVTDVQRFVGAAKNVSEGHSTTMPSS